MRQDIRLSLLPDPFVFRDGTRVTNVAGWEKRRLEILEDTISLEFDGMPPQPEVFEVEPTDLHGRGSTCTYRVHCGRKDKPFTFTFMTYMPNLKGRMPAVVTGDAMYADNMNDAVIAEAKKRGFVCVKFNRTELAPDFPDPDRKHGINALWPNMKFTAISAWAWGYHRVIDALLTLDYIDPDRIAVSGHSRGGKTALLAGATDTRIRYTNPNGSGTHGCGAYRFLQRETAGQYADQISEPLEFMMKNIGYWMGQGLWDYVGREGELPYDSHFIKALIAPRCYIETNGYGDIWANPRGAYLSWQAARETWKLYSAEKNCACWYRFGGHGHHLPDFTALFDFMDADIAGTPLPESISRAPYDDMEPLYDWSCPVL